MVGRCRPFSMPWCNHWCTPIKINLYVGTGPELYDSSRILEGVTQFETRSFHLSKGSYVIYGRHLKLHHIRIL